MAHRVVAVAVVVVVVSLVEAFGIAAGVCGLAVASTPAAGKRPALGSSVGGNAAHAVEAVAIAALNPGRKSSR